MIYSEKLLATKDSYFFEQWKEMYFGEEGEDDGMEQYTEENCNRAKEIMDNLIDELINLGENAEEYSKISSFQKAVEDYNELNDEYENSLIETVEREQLCELLDNIAIVSGIDLNKLEGGNDIAGEWREW
jgi:hypothetical protein